jgi:uncharacterized metal-binding protein
VVSGKPDLFVCSGGALFGIICSPDADVDAGNISNTIIKQKAGWFGERLWRKFWSGYSGSFKHGRFASHFPIFGTFVRLAYIYFWLIFLPHALIKLLFSPHWELIYVLGWYAKIIFDTAFFVGLAGSDTIHYFLDILTTEHKND